jgi:hypothetical protein
MFNLALLCVLLAASSAMGKVKVFHSIYQGPAVDVCALVGTDNIPLVKNLAAKEQSYYFDVAAGTYDLRVKVAASTPCGGADVIVADDVVIGDNANFYTVVAHGLGTTELPYALLPLTDDNDSPSGETALRFVHSFAGAPDVDIYVDNVLTWQDVPYGEFRFAALAADTYNVKVTVASSDPETVVFQGDLPLMADTTYSVYAYGIVTTLPISPFFGIDATDKKTWVKVVHAVAELDAPNVDVYVNGAKTIAGFQYGDVVGYVQVEAKQTTVEIYLEDTMTSVLTPVTLGDADMAPLAYQTLVAHGASLPIALLRLEDDDTAPEAGSFNVRFAHTSAGSPAVDVLVNGEVAFAGYEYGQVSDYVELATGTYSISVTLAGEPDEVVVSAKDLTISTSEVVSVYAIGIAGETNELALRPLVLEDFPMSKVLEFNSGSNMIPSFFLIVASLVLAFAM